MLADQGQGVPAAQDEPAAKAGRKPRTRESKAPEATAQDRTMPLIAGVEPAPVAVPVETQEPPPSPEAVAKALPEVRRELGLARRPRSVVNLTILCHLPLPVVAAAIALLVADGEAREVREKGDETPRFLLAQKPEQETTTESAGEQTHAETPSELDALLAWIESEEGKATGVHRQAAPNLRRVAPLLSPEQRTLAWLAANQAEIKRLLIERGGVTNGDTANSYASRVAKVARLRSGAVTARPKKRTAKAAPPPEPPSPPALSTEEQIAEALSVIGRWPALESVLGRALRRMQASLAVAASPKGGAR